MDNSNALLGSWVNCATALLVSPVCLQSYEEERRIRTDLELRCQRLTLELADTKQHIQEGDYRCDNYLSIKRFVCVCLTFDQREALSPLLLTVNRLPFGSSLRRWGCSLLLKIYASGTMLAA